MVVQASNMYPLMDIQDMVLDIKERPRISNLAQPLNQLEIELVKET